MFRTILIILCGLFYIAYSKNLPSFLKICHQSDPNLNECVKQSVNALKPKLAQGVSDFDIPKLEPLIIPEIVIDQGSGGISLKSNYSNVTVNGASNFILKSLKIDLKKDRVRIKLWLPFIEVLSDYIIEGRILMMPISGKGESYGNYSSINATVTMQCERIEKNGDTYFNIKDFFVDFELGHANIRLNNLFNGDKRLGDTMNTFLNDNWKHVTNEIKPVLEDTIAAIFKKMANKIFHKYPIDVILPK